MAWYDEAVFYHIYPLGLTGAPKQNSYGEPEHRLNTLIPWISHIKETGCNAIYIGPLFESVGHGYETTDYKKLDSRLGTNEDLTNFVTKCHSQGIKVILDGVFNHTGRDFFAFQDIKKNRENSPYRDWYCNVNFWGNNEYNDGFTYDNWGGYNLLVKLNQHNPAVRDYICDVIRFWVSEFDIDGIRLDAADVLDFNYMQALRHVANEVKADFWLMGEVIHGDYNRWVNEGTLHSVTNYQLHKALYSGHNDHNYFEIAHTVKRLYGMGGLKLYNFVDNHDVERIYTKLNNKAHFVPVHVLLYTLPGVPSVYYGSECGMEGRKERWSDDSLRPALSLEDLTNTPERKYFVDVISKLGKVRQGAMPLSYGDYQELLLTTRQYAFSRNHNGQTVIVTVNNDDNDFIMNLGATNAAEYAGALSGEKVSVRNGRIEVKVKANSGEIWLPAGMQIKDLAPVEKKNESPAEEKISVSEEAAAGKEKATEIIAAKETVYDTDTAKETMAEEADTVEVTAKGADTVKETVAAEEADTVKEITVPEETDTVKETVVEAATVIKTTEIQEKSTDSEASDKKGKAGSTAAASKVRVNWNKSYEDMSIEELQQAILEKMAKNGPITDQMRRDVRENVYHNSLITWVKSFH